MRFFLKIITVQFIDSLCMFSDSFDEFEPELWDTTYRKLLTELCEAKTLSQIRSALGSIPLLVDISHIELPTLLPERRLIMRDSVEGGMITQLEYLIAKVASNHRIPKRVSNSFLETV